MKTPKLWINILTFLAITFMSSITFAEVAIIVNPNNNDTISKKDVAKLYLGKIKRFPSGAAAIPIDKMEGDAARVHFIKEILNKSETQVKSYWSRLIFTGKNVPPQIMESDEEIVAMVSRNPDTIGFVDAGSVNDSVKVLLAF